MKTEAEKFRESKNKIYVSNRPIPLIIDEELARQMNQNMEIYTLEELKAIRKFINYSKKSNRRLEWELNKR